MVRGEDIVCRFGGEEFTLVMPYATLDVAQRRAERIRQAVAATGGAGCPFNGAGPRIGGLTPGPTRHRRARVHDRSR